MKNGFTFVEVLVSLIIAVISVLMMIQAFRMYMDNRDIAILYEKAYEDLNSAYEIGKQIIESGTYEKLRSVKVERSGGYNGCDVYKITINSSSVRSLIGEKNLEINPALMTFKVLHCSSQ